MITPSACADVKPSLVRLARSTYVGALLSFVGRVESLAFCGDACGSVSGGAVIAERCFDSFAGDSNLAVPEAVVTAEPAALDVDGMKEKSRQGQGHCQAQRHQDASKIEVRFFWPRLDAKLCCLARQP